MNTVSEEIQRQQDLFVAEQKRQKELVGRIEKIEVNCVESPDKTTTVLVNKQLSTPYDCARRKCTNIHSEIVIMDSSYIGSFRF